MVTFDIEITSATTLRSIKTYLEGLEITDLTKETFENPNSDTYVFSYTTTDLNAGQTLSFTFEVMDANGGIVRSEYSIEVTRAVELDINEFYTLKIGAQASTDAGPFLNTTNGEIMYETELLPNQPISTLPYSIVTVHTAIISYPRLMQASKLFSKHRMQ